MVVMIVCRMYCILRGMTRYLSLYFYVCKTLLLVVKGYFCVYIKICMPKKSIKKVKSIQFNYKWLPEDLQTKE